MTPMTAKQAMNDNSLFISVMRIATTNAGHQWLATDHRQHITVPRSVRPLDARCYK